MQLTAFCFFRQSAITQVLIYCQILYSKNENRKEKLMIVIHVLSRYDSDEKLLISSNCIKSIVKKKSYWQSFIKNGQ